MSKICFPFSLALFMLCFNAVTSRGPSNCCLTNSKDRIPINRVKDYTVQKAGVCPIDAVVLRTVIGRVKCFDPDTKWIKDIMRKVDQKKLGKQASPKPNGKRRKKNKRKQKKKSI